jgi:hypothetical protein
VLATCVAGRERDWQFARDALGAGLVDVKVLLARVSSLPISDAHQQQMLRILDALEIP